MLAMFFQKLNKTFGRPAFIALNDILLPFSGESPSKLFAPSCLCGEWVQRVFPD